jgi:hypothetical protein
MKNGFPGLKALMLFAALTVGWSMTGCKVQPANALSCTPQYVTIDPQNPSDRVYVCVGNNITWSSTVDFDIIFQYPPLTDVPPTSSNPHPLRTSDLAAIMKSANNYVATGYDAEMVSPSTNWFSCMTWFSNRCYKYTIQFKNGTPPIDPHVIIMPPG